MRNLYNDWEEILQRETQKEYYLKLEEFLLIEYEVEVVYPPKENIFRALEYTSYNDTKVVILGQDPYHGKGQAQGLSFSVEEGIKIPPSLKNIYKELHQDLGVDIPNHGNLTKWALQGVLLLNTTLTVREGKPNSHRKKGWVTFTNEIIRILNDREKPIVFILWGNDAHEKEGLITNPLHCVIKSPHPSPLSASRGFFGSKPFSKANSFLRKVGQGEVDWRIENI